VEDYKQGKWTEKPEWTKGSISTFHHQIVIWSRTYDLHGLDGLKHKPSNKDWTAEERFELVAKVLAGNSMKSVAIEAGINDGQLYRWVRKYKLYGYDGLQLKKGRKPKDPIMSKDNKPNELSASEREELTLLRRQNEYLRADNAYLKKLKALIAQKKEESSVKAKKLKSSEDSGKKDTD
jgi:transposase